MGIDLPCDGKCEECKFDDCILTEEQALQLDIYENGENNALDIEILKSRCGCGDRKQKDRARHKLFYELNKDLHKARVKRYKETHKEYYREYEKKRKEYQHQYYLKKKGEKNVNKENVSVGSNNLIDNGNNSST